VAGIPSTPYAAPRRPPTTQAVLPQKYSEPAAMKRIHEWQMICHICPPISTSTTKQTTCCFSSVSSRQLPPHCRISKPFRRPQIARPAQKGHSAPDWSHLHRPICFSWRPALMCICSMVWYRSCRSKNYSRKLERIALKPNDCQTLRDYEQRKKYLISKEKISNI
jgi:hypothetical protein